MTASLSSQGDKKEHYPTPPPEARPEEERQSSTGNGLGISIAHRETAVEEADISPRPHRRNRTVSSGHSRPLEAFKNGDRNVEEKEKVLKLSPQRLGELLEGATLPLKLQSVPSPPRSPTRSRRSTTVNDAFSPSRPRQSRTLSTPPPSARWTSSSSKSPLESPHQSARGVKDERQPVVHQHHAEPSSAESHGSPGIALDDVDETTPARRFRAKWPTPSIAGLPPYPLHSYLSLALASPKNSPFPTNNLSTLQSGEASGAKVYGLPPHDPRDSAGLAMERVMNFFLLPPKLEGAVIFGVLVCLDSWLYIFTILPLRFVKAIGVLLSFWRTCVTDYIFNYDGNKLQKKRKPDEDPARRTPDEQSRRRKKRREIKKSSDLGPSHKADILRGAVLFTSCWILMHFDASKIYHSVRGQSGIKLYVIYNMLDFGDRLCAALGQDIFECLFSRDALERRPDGRSKIWRPFGFFLLALAYNVLHSLALFYQVITLNVAVNSYSNALITLLLSVQFVEIKTTVFKRFDKENLFQLSCADVVERFQLGLMLSIILARNMVEMGFWSLSQSGDSVGSILPKSFTFFPQWTGHIMGPFFMVLGSEMVVDWMKHAYITRFNNFRPIVYERFLDVQCKDYYTHAFTDQNLTKRFGLPVLPLACLFIRATIQTYHMFLATNVPSTLTNSTSSALTENVAEASPALAGVDSLLRRALSRSSFGGASDVASTWADGLVAAGTMFVFLAACFLVFLAVKLVLGVLLLGFAERRCRTIKERDRMHAHTGGKSGGAFGVVQVSDEQRSRIYEGDPKGEKGTIEREKKTREHDMKVEMDGLEKVERYKMVSKRIW